MILSRRNFLAGACALGVTPSAWAAEAPERPNLVVGIVSDPHANSPENNRYLHITFKKIPRDVTRF